MDAERHWFKARLGPLDECAQERWKNWAQRACRGFYLFEQGGESLISAERGGAADTRALGRLLRTLASHWKINIPKFGKEEWLWLITQQEFDDGAPTRPQSSNALPTEKVATSRTTPAIDIQREPIEFLHCLPPEFAERSQHMLMALRACA